MTQLISRDDPLERAWYDYRCQSSRDKFREFQSLLNQSGVRHHFDYDIDKIEDMDDVMGLLCDIALFYTTSLSRNKPNRGFPPGYWYMITITQKDTETKEQIIERHNVAMEYFRYHHIEVYHAALEKAGSYHVHYSVKIQQPKKNEERDLRKLTGRIVRIEKVANTLQKWQGLFKYVMKRDYQAEKSDTQCETLLSRVVYEEGKGYTLTD